MAIAAGDYTNIRKGYHHTTPYLSVLKPKTLWVGTVTAAAARGITAVTFDTGSGLDWSAVGPDQVIWVGSGIGKKDYGVLRIRSVSSGDGGVTGTANVAWHGYAFGPGAFLTFVHDYPIFAKYPWLGQAGVMGTQEVFYKDVFDQYTNQTQASQIKPVGDVDIWPRAGWLLDGELAFWVDASASYPMAPGATISTYGLSVYPSTGVTTTFNTSTGIGRVVVTDPTEDYYYLTITITDSNGSVRTLREAVFSHSQDPTDGTLPLSDLTLGQFTDDWESGGVAAQIQMHRRLTDIFIGDRQAVDMIDTAFSVLWGEFVVGRENIGKRRVPTVRTDEHLWVSPDVSITVTSSATCDIDTTLHAGVRTDDAIPVDSTVIGLHVQVNAETPIAVNGTVTGGIITATETGIAAPLGACSGGVVKWLFNSQEIARTEIWPGKLYTGESIYPSRFLAYPMNFCVGYLRENDVDQESESGTGQHSYSLESADALLKNNYMFSIPVDAKASPTKWHHFHDQMTTAAAAFFVMDFHSSVLECMSVVGLDADADLRPYGEFQGANLWQLIDGIVRNEGIRAHFKCDRNGKMHLIYDVQLLTDSERAVVPITSTVDDQDRGGELSIKVRPEPNVALVYGSGIYWGGTFDGDGKVGSDEVEAYCSLAPWYIPHWGGGGATSNFERQTTRSQAHMNAVTGRVYAAMNNRYPTFSFGWVGNYLPLLLIDETFWQITLQVEHTPKSLVFPNQKIILRSIECTFTDGPEAGGVVVNTTWETEADGLDGVTAVCPDIDIDIGGLPPVSWTEASGFLPGTIITSS
jgi:hypothetical protein